MALLIDTHLTFEDHVRMSQIEREYFQSDYYDSPELSWELFCKNSETFLCVRDTENGKIAAHLTLIPVTDETFESILSGDMIDSTITADQILKYDVPGEYKLHLLAVAIAMEYRNGLLFAILYRAFKKKIMDLAKRGIVITGISADCVCEESEILCVKLLNMNFVKLSPRNSKIYWADSLVAK